MHGNEPVGWEAVRELLRHYWPGGGEQSLPRSLTVFIGNVSAAAHGLRHLDGQPDYNRVWPGCEDGKRGSEEHRMMQQVVDTMVGRGLFASVDLHNNTGLNPHYACINTIDNRFMHLATMFGRLVVYFIRPCGVQSMAMAQHCPAVTLECGKVGQSQGVEHARNYLEEVLHLPAYPTHKVEEQDIDLLHTVATVKIPDSITFGFGDEEVDICFTQDLDNLNFRELPRGTSLGRVNLDSGLGLEVYDEQGREVSQHYFVLDGGELLLRDPVIPSMLTRDKTVVRQDCLCYLMERYGYHLL
jgi:succinylglutamate desuccinylase